MTPAHQQPYNTLLKPAIDRLAALVGLVVSLPVTLVLTVLLAWANQGKPFFFQMRPGLRGKPFRIVKFKTMNDRRGADGELLPDAERLTPVGSFVRKTSLDELPQLWNVLLGDLSLIGPRPLLMEYLPLYSPEQARRHLVRPGITGWAQVNGRNAISWPEKFRLDGYYVDHVSAGLDGKIVWKTILNVLRAKDISSATSATMEKFTGKE
jgi:lipopolysaccharide/colanic/teichoic acid biosynthesis glycosyltransferase